MQDVYHSDSHYLHSGELNDSPERSMNKGKILVTCEGKSSFDSDSESVNSFKSSFYEKEKKEHDSFLMKRRNEERHCSLVCDNIIDELNLLKEEYYKENGKNLLFKKKQKMEIAKKICNNFDLLFLFRKTVFRIKNTNIIFMDYKFFKIYMNETIYDELIKYMLFIYDETIKLYGSYLVHVDVDTITPSALERYKEVIIRFNKKCVHTDYVNKLEKWVIYNVPSFIETFVSILTVIIHPDIFKCSERYSKEESPALINDLLKKGLDDLAERSVDNSHFKK